MLRQQPRRRGLGNYNMRQECPVFEKKQTKTKNPKQYPNIARGKTSKDLTVPRVGRSRRAETERSKEAEHRARPTGTCEGNERYSV